MGKFKPLYLLGAWAHQSALFLNISGLLGNIKFLLCNVYITEVIQDQRGAK